MLARYARYNGLSRPSRETLDQPDERAPGSWDLADARAAIERHEVAEFESSAALAEAMGRDDRIGAVFRTRANAVVARNGDVELQPLEGAGSRATRLVKIAEEWFWKVVTDAWLRETVTNMVGMGFSLSRIVWERIGRQYRPAKLITWYAHNVGWNRELRCYTARTTDDVLDVLPGDPNWLLITPGGERSWLSGAVRALGTAYVFRNFDRNMWLRYNERHGNPIFAIREPASGVGDNTRINKESFYAQMRRIGSSGVVKLPQMGNGVGYDMSVVEPTSRSWESFKALKAECDTDIAIAILGQNLSTEVKGGSFAAATAHENVRADYRGNDIETLSTALHDQLLAPWAFRSGLASDERVIPWPTWDQSERFERGEYSTTVFTFAQAAEKLDGRPEIGVDLPAVAERLGIPLLSPAERRKRSREAKRERKPDDDDDDATDDENGSSDDDGADAPDPAARRTTARTVRTASGMPLAVSSGFVEGQLYADAVTDSAKARASSEAIAPYIADLLAIIDDHDDYESIRSAVLARYRDADPVRHAEIVQLALSLAQLGGRAAVVQGDE